MNSESAPDIHRAMVEAYLNVKADFDTTTSEIRDHKELIKALEDDQKSLQQELMGMESYLRRHNINPDELAAPPTISQRETPSNVISIASANIADEETSGYQSLTSLKRVDAVVAALSTAKTPMSRADIHEHLVMGGREDTLGDVSLALTGLKRQDRAYQVSRGQWLLSPE